MIRLENGQFGWDFVIRDLDTDDTRYIQSDYDYPGTASNFGWVIPCACGSSDGTVDCPCGTAGEFISKARHYLKANLGKVVEDPGYFGEARNG